MSLYNNKEIEEMNFDELRAEVSAMRLELTKYKRLLDLFTEDIENSALGKSLTMENGRLRTQIKAVAGEISTKVANVEKNVESTVMQLPNSIKAIVLENIVDTSKAEETDTVPDNTTSFETSKIYKYVKENSTDYYRFNTITNKWEVIEDGKLMSIFELLPEGVKLKGDIKIDGSCILTESLTFNSDSKPVDVQYSKTGADNTWHDTFNPGSDKFMRIKIGSQWSSAMKVVGDDGEPGGFEEFDPEQVNSILADTYKITKTEVGPTTIASPRINGGEFFGNVFYAGEGFGYSQMDEDGFTVYDNNEDQKIKIGYVESDWNYPFILLGQGTGWAENGSCCVYKFGSGIWIGDSCIAPYGGRYPGQQNDANDISKIDEVKNATGIFIDLQKDKIYKYIKGVPEEISSGGSSSGGCDGTCVAVFA